MSFRADYHVHLEKGPYTQEWVGAFLAAGRRAGLSELGFSEHLHDLYEGPAVSGRWWEVETDPLDREHAHGWWRSRPRAHMDEYVNLVRGTPAQGLTVRLGLEVDYFAASEEPLRQLLAAYPLDYALGSVHWLGGWGFDHMDRLERWQGRDVDTVFRRYFALLVQAARSRLFDVIAHADVVKLAGYRPSFDLTPLYEEAARSFAEAGVAVEVSTAGLRRPVRELYPAEPFLHLCRAHGVPIVLSSDAHRPEDVARDIEAAVALARACGYTHTSRFVRREREEMPL